MTREALRALLRQAFPNLSFEDFDVTSPETPVYNCIAWAAGDQQSHWWPSPVHGPPIGGYYWPAGLPHDETVANFVEAYEREGYEVVGDDAHEPGFERVAIYASSSGAPLHAARQLPSGKWTSKLGQSFDIEHATPTGVAGGSYGDPIVYMRRVIDSNRPPPGARDSEFI